MTPAVRCMLTCLYCDETKPSEQFNREHVIPEAFGKFVNNLVLHKIVCSECNTYFSRELELTLTRDSAEALLRFNPSLANQSKMQKFGRGLMQCQLRGGAADGAIAELRPLDGVLKAFLVDQIGCATSSSGPFEWYELKALPDREGLIAKGYAPGKSYFRFLVEEPTRVEEALEALRSRGYKPGQPTPDGAVTVGADDKVDTTILGAVNRVVVRAVAKIAFNYFAYHYQGIARLDQFSDIRRFIRYGDWPLDMPVHVSQGAVFGGIPDDRQVLAHVATVSPFQGEIRAQVSLFSAFLYKVRLGPNLVIAPEFVDKGHLFNPFTRRIVELRQAQSLGEMMWSPPMEQLPEGDAT